MTDVKPWHDAPKCKCGESCVTPSRFSAHGSALDSAHQMYCPSCGDFWVESDIEVIAKAFQAYGAWEGHRASR